jgi:hypothetical protein
LVNCGVVVLAELTTLVPIATLQLFAVLAVVEVALPASNNGDVAAVLVWPRVSINTLTTSSFACDNVPVAGAENGEVVPPDALLGL